MSGSRLRHVGLRFSAAKCRAAPLGLLDRRKPTVRLVVHRTLPPAPESYYREGGPRLAVSRGTSLGADWRITPYLFEDGLLFGVGNLWGDSASQAALWRTETDSGG